MYVNASDVAKLIGRHPYESAEVAFSKVVGHSRKWGGETAAAAEMCSVINTTPFNVDNHREVVALGISQAVQCTSEAHIVAAISTAVQAITEKTHEACLAETAVRFATAKKRKRLDRLARELGSVVDAVDTVDAVDALRLLKRSTCADAAAALREVADKMQAASAEIAPVVTSKILTERGNALESPALDAFEAEHGTRVSQRNSIMRYLSTQRYVIGGRMDGFDEARHEVVEVKNRKRMWPTVPAYDIVQVRTYVAMLHDSGLHDATGRLLERFPDGNTRETPVAHDLAEWSSIHAALERVCDRFDALTSDQVLDLMIATRSIR